MFPWRIQTRPFKIAHPGRRRSSAWSCTKTAGAAQTNLAEIELLAGGDVQLGGGDITVTAATDVPATSGAAVSVPLATVTGGTASGYQATVDWADGSPVTAGHRDR